MAASGHFCILECIRNVQSPLLAPALLAAASSKADNMRLRASEYYFEIISVWPDKILQKVDQSLIPEN